MFSSASVWIQNVHLCYTIRKKVGYRKWRTHARVFSQTLAHGNSKNCMKRYSRTEGVWYSKTKCVHERCTHYLFTLSWRDTPELRVCMKRYSRTEGVWYSRNEGMWYSRTEGVWYSRTEGVWYSRTEGVHEEILEDWGYVWSDTPELRVCMKRYSKTEGVWYSRTEGVYEEILKSSEWYPQINYGF